MIKNPSELSFEDKKLSVIISGVAGIGKTTLALSAPKPLLIDLDKGISRVSVRHRCPVLECSTYEELMDDLCNEDLSAFETIVIDTGGKLLEMLKPVVIKEDAKNGQRDGSLSLKGYGAVKRKFSSFVNFVRSLNKHLVFVFHATEVLLPDDTTGLRIRIEGSSRDEIWDDIDIGGFIEMVGNKRTIGFGNCPRYYAKATYGVKSMYEIPALTLNNKNNFLTLLFNDIEKSLKNETVEIKAYTELMNNFIPEINKIDNLTALNDVYAEIKKAEHHLTSKEELWFALNNKSKEVKAKFAKEKDQFVDE